MSIPADQLRRMLEQTLVPPTQVIELDPDTIGATTARLGSLRGNLAERYQLNSCLTKASWESLADPESVKTILDFYLTTAADGYDQLIKEASRWVMPFDDAPAWVRDLLSPLSGNPVVVSMLFSADLLVAFDSALWKVIPNRSGLQFEGSWNEDLARQALSAVPPYSARESLPDGFVFAVGNIVRSSYLSGDRAFRQAATACGVLLGQLWAVLAGLSTPLQFVPATQFIDHLVNDATRCDGVERGVQVMGIVDIPKPSFLRIEDNHG